MTSTLLGLLLWLGTSMAAVAGGPAGLPPGLAAGGLPGAAVQAPTDAAPAVTELATDAGAVVAEGGADPAIDLMKVVKGEQKLTAEQLIRFGPWINALTSLLMTVLSFVPRLFVASFLMCVFWVIYRAVRRMVRGALAKANVDSSIHDMLQAMVKWAIMGFGTVVACNQLGIPIVAMLTGVSIIGLAVGFAAQETLANFIAGIVIFWDKPFKAGDWIKIDGHLAQVKRITFRSTRLDDLDGDVVVHPNTAMLSTKVVNKSANPVTRCNVPVSIAYKESIERARGVLLGLLEGDDRVVDNPQAEVILIACAAAKVDLSLRFWIREEQYEHELIHEYLEKAKLGLDAAMIEVPGVPAAAPAAAALSPVGPAASADKRRAA